MIPENERGRRQESGARELGLERKEDSAKENEKEQSGRQRETRSAEPCIGSQMRNVLEGRSKISFDTCLCSGETHCGERKPDTLDHRISSLSPVWTTERDSVPKQTNK